jgi:nucleoside phosphorylase
MNKTFSGWDEIDVLIVTAIRDEFLALLDVNAGAIQGSKWNLVTGKAAQDRYAGFEVAFRAYRAATGDTLRVGATYALGMGGVAAADVAAALVARLKPRYLGMCGVCAGRRGEINLGDVIIADRLWTYDAGSTTVEKDARGRERTVFKADPTQYSLPAVWIHPAQRFFPDTKASWIKRRPRSYEAQGDWLLSRLLANENPLEHPAQEDQCANFELVVDLLRRSGRLTQRGICLSKAGRTYIENKHLLNPGGLSRPAPFSIKIGPIGTGTTVVRNPHIFAQLSARMRKVLGLEMEACAIAAIAHHYSLQSIVMKGVMDYADPSKGDNFKKFSARASAECLVAFLLENCAPNWVSSDGRNGNRSLEPRIDHDRFLNYCLTDVTGNAVIIPSRLSSLSEREVAAGSTNAGDWKRLHTCAENLLRWYDGLNEQIIRCDQSVRSADSLTYNSARRAAQSLIQRMPSNVAANLSPLCQVNTKSEKLREIEIVLGQLSSPTVQNVLDYHLSFEIGDARCSQSVERVLSVSSVIHQGLLMGALTMADQVLEKHFGRI